MATALEAPMHMHIPSNGMRQSSSHNSASASVPATAATTTTTTPASVIPLRRRRSVEVIEVMDSDSDEVEIYRAPTSGSASSARRWIRRPAAEHREGRRRRVEVPDHELIEILDSDEDVEGGGGRQEGGGSSRQRVGGSHGVGPSRSRNSRSGVRLISPPPPNSTSTSANGRDHLYDHLTDIPPVPRVPRRFSQFQSFPVHPRSASSRRLPPSPPPVVRPVGNDLDLFAPAATTSRRGRVSDPGSVQNQAGQSGPSNQVNHHLHTHHAAAGGPFGPVVPMEPAPVSRHRPVMGLGGALISTNQAQTRATAALQREQRQARRSGLMDHVRRSAAAAARSVYDTAANGVNILTFGNGFAHAFYGAGGEGRGVDVGAGAGGGGRRSGGGYDWLGGGGLFGGAAGFDEDDGPFYEMDDRDDRFSARLQLEMAMRYELLHNQRYLRRNRGAAVAQYQSSYTHRGVPEVGFTFDFAPSAPPASGTADADAAPAGVAGGSGDVAQLDSKTPLPTTPSNSRASPILVLDDSPVAGPSLAKVKVQEELPPENTLLVCARCLEPLVLGGGGFPGGREEERRKKVWGLRCGHLIDGKCLAEIGGAPSKKAEGGPVELVGDDEASLVGVDVKGKGKGKAKATLVLGDEDDDGNQEEEDGDEGDDDDDEWLGMNNSVPSPVDDNPIRSRLRSRRSQGGESGSSRSSTTTATRQRALEGHGRRQRHLRRLMMSPSSPPPPPVVDHGVSTAATKKRKARRRGGGLGKQRAGAAQEEAYEEYEWKCPVVSCGHVHVSVKRDGEWVPEKVGNKGAVGVFV